MVRSDVSRPHAPSIDTGSTHSDAWAPEVLVLYHGSRHGHYDHAFQSQACARETGEIYHITLLASNQGIVNICNSLLLFAFHLGILICRYVVYLCGTIRICFDVTWFTHKA